MPSRRSQELIDLRDDEPMLASKRVWIDELVYGYEREGTEREFFEYALTKKLGAIIVKNKLTAHYLCVDAERTELDDEMVRATGRLVRYKMFEFMWREGAWPALKRFLVDRTSLSPWQDDEEDGHEDEGEGEDEDVLDVKQIGKKKQATPVKSTAQKSRPGAREDVEPASSGKKNKPVEAKSTSQAPRAGKRSEADERATDASTGKKQKGVAPKITSPVIEGPGSSSSVSSRGRKENAAVRSAEASGSRGNGAAKAEGKAAGPSEGPTGGLGPAAGPSSDGRRQLSPTASDMAVDNELAEPTARRSSRTTRWVGSMNEADETGSEEDDEVGNDDGGEEDGEARYTSDGDRYEEVEIEVEEVPIPDCYIPSPRPFSYQMPRDWAVKFTKWAAKYIMDSKGKKVRFGKTYLYEVARMMGCVVTQGIFESTLHASSEVRGAFKTALLEAAIAGKKAADRDGIPRLRKKHRDSLLADANRRYEEAAAKKSLATLEKKDRDPPKTPQQSTSKVQAGSGETTGKHKEDGEGSDNTSSASPVKGVVAKMRQQSGRENEKSSGSKKRKAPEAGDAATGETAGERPARKKAAFRRSEVVNGVASG
ncbi:hypothetical protein AURDEDRAFT_160992 [Auricularia subglabra TFB-10046 SS5]|nr:hypothetical protein AURDEDRAFT_160992 [Auricularia subglabra TFB-10046 SS5]